MIWNERVSEPDRHRRAATYALMSFGLAVFGHLQLQLDQGQTLAYAVLAYVILNALNYRAMFGAPISADGVKDGDGRPGG